MSDQVEKGVLGLKNKLEGEIFVCQNLWLQIFRLIPHDLNESTMELCRGVTVY